MTSLNDRKGFTLLELMISLTILGLIATVIFSSLRLGLRTWEKGEEKVEQYQRIRVVLEILESQLRSTYPYIIQDEKTKEQFPFFQGEKDSIKFVSPISFKTEEPMGLSLVSYKVAGQGRGALQYSPAKVFLASEELILNKDIFKEESIKEKEEIELFPQLKQISFQYYGKKKENETNMSQRDTKGNKNTPLPPSGKGWMGVFSEGKKQWDEKWNAKEEGVLPQAVKIFLDFNRDYEENPSFFHTITIPLSMGQREE